MENVELPQWLSVHRVFLYAPRWTKDTERYRWLCYSWCVTDRSLEEFQGLLPMHEYYETEYAAWASLGIFLNNKKS